MAIGLLNSNTIPHTLPDASHNLTDPQTRMKATADDFETTFLNTMFSQMFSEIKPDAISGGGSAEESWRGLLVNEYAKTVTKAGGIGLSKQIYNQLVRVQEQSIR